MGKNIRSITYGSIKGEMLFDEPMARHTSLQVGGPADCLATPTDLSDLRSLIRLLAECGIPYFVLGGGYNQLVRDGGFRGVAIALPHFGRLERLVGNRLLVEAGVQNQRLLSFCREEGLTGLEFLSGIPGTAGGALSMNAGVQGETILERVASITTLREGDIKVSHRDSLRFGYRFLRLEPGEIILAAVLQLATDEPVAIDLRIKEHQAKRKENQQVGYASAGSFFKNPPESAAWRLIDAAGLKGYRIGGAQVSEVHANFLINRGGATAADFLALARLIKEKVKVKTGVDLEEEVRIVGED